MVSVSQMAQMIEDKLNAIAEASNYNFTFKIHPNLGELQAFSRGSSQRELPKPVINCVLEPLSSTVVPIKDLKSYLYSQALTILAPATRSDGINNVIAPNGATFNIDEPLSVIQTYVEDTAGLCGSIDDYAYVINNNTPSIGQFQLVSGMGEAVPIYLNIAWQFIEGGIVGNLVKITIDDITAIMLEGNIARTRISDTTNKENSDEMKSIVGQQGLTWRVVVPYIRDSVGAKLVKDGLIGTLEKTYTLTYDDGVVKTETGENPRWTVVATEMTENIQAGRVVSVTGTFVIASDSYSEEE